MKQILKFLSKLFEKTPSILLTHEGMTNMIIMLIGIVLITWGTPNTVLVSIGSSIVASSIVAFLSAIYAYEFKVLRMITDVWGLTRIEETRAFINEQVDKATEDARYNIDIIAYGLSSLRETKTYLIEKKLNDGVKFRILTVDKEYEYLKLKDFDEDKKEGYTKESIIKLTNWCKELKQKTGKEIEIRFVKFLPTELYYRIDNSIFVGPYEIGRDSQRTITVRFDGENTKGFKYYAEYFKTLWDKNEPVSSSDNFSE